MLGCPNAHTPLLAAALIAAALTVGCGSGEPDEPTAPKPAPAAGEDLAAIKAYLLDHTASLVDSTQQLADQGAAYRELAEGADFDYAALLDERRADVRSAVEDMQKTWREANPRYRDRGAGGRARTRARARPLTFGCC